MRMRVEYIMNYDYCYIIIKKKKEIENPNNKFNIL